MKTSLYAKYYFELRVMHKDNEKEFPSKPLNNEEARKLEIRSREIRDIFEGYGLMANENLNLSFGSLPPKNIWR